MKKPTPTAETPRKAFLCALSVSALVLGFALSAQAQTACPSTGWCHTWSTSDSRAAGTGSMDNSWSGLAYVEPLHRWYRWLTDKRSVSPNDNAMGSYEKQDNYGLSTNPWTLRMVTGEDGTAGTRTTIWPTAWFYYGGTALDGSGLCNHATATAASTTICGVFPSANFPSADCTTNTPGAGTCGAVLLDDEVIEYGSITRSTADSSQVVLGNLIRGSRNLAGNPSCSDAGGAYCSHTYVASTARYLVGAAPTAAQAPATGGMKVDVGAGLAAVPAGGDVPPMRHPTRALDFDANAGRLWQFSGWLEGPSYQDIWYWCLPGVSSPNGKCDSTKIAKGWIRVVVPTYFPKGNYETSGVYDPVHDAIFSYGSDASNQMWVYSDSTNAVIGSVAGDLKQLTITCQNAAGGTIACPYIGAQQMVWDGDDNLIMMFGGRNGTTRYDNIVVYNPANTTVSGIPGRTLRVLASAGLSCTSASSACYFPAFAYDTTRHKGMVYAGPGQLLQYTYAASGGTWANTGVTGGPEAQTTQPQGSLSYAPDTDMYLYAATSAVGGRTDTWQLPGATISGGSVPGSGTKYSGMTLQGVEIQ